jgi:hypothetical protein
MTRAVHRVGVHAIVMRHLDLSNINCSHSIHCNETQRWARIVAFHAEGSQASQM